ncbi:MAG TPA: porin, partial [Thermodesulfobacteriota bacterium]|nr:porin [Thermodesulfobacteriota bacterium]
ARDEGAAIYGVLGNYIVYGAGVFNGDGRNGISVDSNLLYAGRVQFTPCCGELKYKQGQFPTGGEYNFEPNFGPNDNVLIAISTAAAVIPGLNTERKTLDNSSIDDRFAEIGTVDADVFSFTMDVNLRYSIFSLDGEYIFRRISPEESDLSNVNDQGFRVQGGLFVIPQFIEVAGRFAYIDFDGDVDGKDKKWEITPGLGFYFSKSYKWKLQFGYSFIREEDTAGEETDSNTFRTQIQVYF